MKLNLDFDLKLVSQICLLTVITIVVVYLFVAMVGMSKRNMEQQPQKIKEVIDKALVQCYALEGAFPSDIYYLEKYGVLFDDDKYLYDYDIFGVNYFPQVTVISKS